MIKQVADSQNFSTNTSDLNNETCTVSKAVLAWVVQNRKQTMGRKIRSKCKEKLGIHKVSHKLASFPVFKFGGFQKIVDNIGEKKSKLFHKNLSQFFFQLSN